MTPDRSIHALFDAAVELPDPAERGRFLDEACGSDSELRAQLEKLLSAHENAGGFLSHPSQPPPQPPTLRGSPVVPPTEKPGDRIGRYKLLEQIGEGGCGFVYMAEQEEPVRRRVALKIIKLGMDTKQVVARFEAERQALALMDHPHIARVLDAGATESGRPFFVMELVRGMKITKFCDQQKIPPHGRLELLLQICSAIQHAHQKGIIHRDLKPSNILVTTVDGVPVSKVIDFGIAKATTSQRLTDKTLFTAFEQFIGTPAYMSPEQAEMSGVDIDTRTDIYSLGVVLYELLAGKTPFDAEDFVRASIDEIRRTIREREPPKPSTRLGTLAGEEATTVADARKTEMPALVKVVRGDLDWIVMKCLEKDRNRRYETANDLAMDIRRHLDNLPIVARPTSNLYRFRKLVERHRAVSALSGILLVSLLAGGVMLWRSERQLRRSLAAEQKSRGAEMEALYSSLLGQARAQRQSGRMGQRFDTLETIRQAAQIRRTPELRNALAATLALPDLRLERKWPVQFSYSRTKIDFAPDLGSYIEPTTNGVFTLRSAQNQATLERFPSTSGFPVLHATISSNGQRVAVAFRRGRFQIWERGQTEPLLKLSGIHSGPAVPDFHPDGNTVAANVRDKGLTFFSLSNGSARELGSSTGRALALRFDPQGERLAVVREQCVEMWSCQSNTLLWTAPISNAVAWVAWSPNGRWLLASSDRTQEMFVLESVDGHVLSRYPLQRYTVNRFEFHPNDLSFVSAAEDRNLRFCDLMTGEELLRCPAGTRALQFSLDGKRLAASAGEMEVGHYELATVEVFRELWPLTLNKTSPAGFARSSTGRFLLSSADDQLVIWDTDAREAISSVRAVSGPHTALFFGPGDKEIYFSRTGPGVTRRTFDAQVNSSTKRLEIRLGPELTTTPYTNEYLCDLGRDGRLWLTQSPTRKAYLWPDGDRERSAGPIVPAGNWSTMRLSPSARWILTTVYPGADLTVWSVRGRTNAHTFSGYSVEHAQFSPDGQWVVGRTPGGYRVWKLGTWEPGPIWPADLGDRAVGNIAFAQGGRLIALQDSDDSFRLLTFPEGRELVRLQPPITLGIFGALMNEEGTRLWLLGFGNRIYEWNLTVLRKELARFGLDWQD